jgi:hypothetical protein
MGPEGRAQRQQANGRQDWQQALQGGRVRNRAELTRRLGLSRARVTQVLGPVPAS